MAHPTDLVPLDSPPPSEHVNVSLADAVLAAAVVLSRVAGTDRVHAAAGALWRREIELPRAAPVGRARSSLGRLPARAITLTVGDSLAQSVTIERPGPAGTTWWTWSSPHLSGADLTERTWAVLRAARAQPAMPLRELPVLSRVEVALHAELDAIADPGIGAGCDPSDALRSHAGTCPGAIALVHGSTAVSYAELDARVDRFAAGLRALGGRAGRVAFLLERSGNLVVAILAALRAGITFTALNPRHPAAHVSRMLRTAAPLLVVAEIPVESAYRVLTPAQIMQGVQVTGIAPDGASDPVQDAYVLFTSGSTGRPKGAVIGRAALSAYLAAVVPAYGLGSKDRVLHIAEPGFDVLLEEVLASVVAGARIVVADPSCLDSPASFLAFIRDHGVTVVNLPSSLWAALFVPEGSHALSPPADLRLVVVGSERVPAPAYLAWHDTLPRRVRLVNAYGTTETTITSIVHDPECPDRALVRRSGSVPIGRPLANTSVRVVDTYGDPTPIDVAGELVIGGASVLRGYLADSPERRCAGSASEPRTHYRTGDLVVIDRSGVLLYAGRVDAQLKIRGRRIEPAEVEVALEALPGVRAALCTTIGADANTRLVGVIVPATPADPPDPAEIRAGLARLLPDWLVPDRIELTSALPVNAHGKLDRTAVGRLFTPASGEAQPELAPHASAPPGATQGEAIRLGVNPSDGATRTQSLVADLVARLLGCATPTPSDNFFALGGNSVQAIRLVAQLSKKLGRAMPARQVFLTPTIAEIARAVQAPQSGTVAIVQTAGRSTSPLTPGQQAMLRFLGSPATPRPYFEMFEAFRIHGRLDPAALQRSLRGVVRENEALRSTVDPAGQCQRVMPGWEPTMEQIDLSAMPPSAKDRALAEAMQAAQRPFDLTAQPAFRTSLARLGPDEHVLLLTFHHLFFDGWSYGLFYERLGELYAAETASVTAAARPARPQFGDYAHWLAQVSTDELRAADIAYWRDTLAGYRPPEICRRLAAAQCSSSVASRRIDAATTAALEALATSCAVTPFALLSAAFAIVLSHLVAYPDLLLASNDANRYQAGTEEMMGYLTVTQLSRVRLGADDPFAEVAARAHATLAASRQHMSVQWEDLIAELGLRDAVQFRFSLQDTPSAGTLHLRGLDARVLPEQVQSGGRRAIVVNAWRRAQGFELQWYTRDDLGLPTSPQLALEMYAATLARAVADPRQGVAALQRALAAGAMRSGPAASTPASSTPASASLAASGGRT